MADAPYTKHREAQFRGPTTSDDYNARIEENYRDLVVLVNRARISEVEADELKRRVSKELYALYREVSDLTERVEALEVDEAHFSFFSNTHVDVARFDAQPGYVIPEISRLSVDTKHGIATLPKVDTSSLSKFFFTNTDGLEVVPPSLEARAVGTASTADNTTALIDTSRPELALYRKPGLIWERNVVVDSPNVNGAEVTLYLRVPTELFTTEKSNAVVIHPFPAFGVTVREISYSINASPLLEDSDGYVSLNSGAYWEGDPDAVGWVTPGGWDGDEADVGPRIYYFPPKPITALKIRLHQDEHFVEAGNYIYTYGLAQLDLRYDKFLAEGKTILRFDAPDGETISDVDSVQPQIYNVPEALVDDVFEYRVIWETAFNSGFYTLDPVANSDRVWIEVTLKNTDGYTPALSGLVLEYS